jgi:hypothetical protein
MMGKQLNWFDLSLRLNSIPSGLLQISENEGCSYESTSDIYWLVSSHDSLSIHTISAKMLPICEVHQSTTSSTLLIQFWLMSPSGRVEQRFTSQMSGPNSKAAQRGLDKSGGHGGKLGSFLNTVCQRDIA